ncbi:hypothetical protein [Plebeiibacterium marinum]|uniref:Uncharacterized protein n=1 Tax=Plebeiibacterium marinum TaxID=2992111 RepID=A0AAE3SJM5_9BACT|nr:hypothetical protein [Plebeiobacterium marinum]MCW3805895.1 hypothetical protein [Plebeiobacterium marinum]
MENKYSSLLLSDKAISHIYGIARWTKFLAVLGFVFWTLYILIALFTNFMILVESTKQVLPFSPISFFITTIAFIVIMFFPIYFLNGFSNKIKRGLKKQNGQDVDLAFKNLRSYYRFIGILTIISLILYTVSVIVFYNLLSTTITEILQGYPTVV